MKKPDLQRARYIMQLNFGTLDIELMREHVTNFSKTINGERYLERFKSYLIQEGLNKEEAGAIAYHALCLNHGSTQSNCWN